MGNAQRQATGCDKSVQEKGIQGPTAPAGVDSQTRQGGKATARHPDHVGSCHASAVSTCPRTRRRKHQRPEELWLQARSGNYRRNGGTLPSVVHAGRSDLGDGRGHQRVLRQHQPRLAHQKRPHGQDDAQEMVEGRGG
ncbi:hypothetical protein FQZ97_718670 [compost metagenome]